MLGDFPSFTWDDHEEVLLTGGGLRKILHDIPVTLNQILYFIRLSISILLLSIFFIVILTAILIPLLLSGFLLLGSFLQKNKQNNNIGDEFSSGPNRKKSRLKVL